MGGKMRITNALRRQAYWRPMLETLAQLGISEYSIDPATGRGHPMLTIQFKGHELRVPLPCSPKSHSDAPRYIPSEIRRRIRGLAS